MCKYVLLILIAFSSGRLNSQTRPAKGFSRDLISSDVPVISLKNAVYKVSIHVRNEPKISLILEDNALQITRNDEEINKHFSITSRGNNVSIEAKDSKSTYKSIALYIPIGAMVVLENKFTDVELKGNLKKADIRLTSGTLRGKNIDTLSVNALFGEVRLDNILSGKLTLNNSGFEAQKMDHSEVISRSSRFHFGQVKYLNIDSFLDSCVILEVDSLKGDLKFSKLKVQLLNNWLDIRGKNTDITINTIKREAGTVSITNNYATINLPLRNLLDYQVNFFGTSTQFVGESMLFGEEERDEQLQPKADGHIKFSKKIGSNIQLYTKFYLDCHACTIDFR